jgi:isoleucyl-tRNA synthetase
MAYVQEVVSLGHALRKEHQLKVRQPLAKAYLISANPDVLSALRAKQHLIADELNVKEVEFESNEADFVSIVAKPHFRILGKKVGNKMNSVQTAIQALPQSELSLLLKGGSVEITVENEKIELTSEDIAVERKVKEGLVASTSSEVTIALDISLNEELLLEGLAREIVNKVNTMRRDEGFAVTDRIVIQLKTTDRVKTAFDLHRDSIMREVLATHVHFDCAEGTEWDLNGEPTTMALSLSVS